MNVVARLHSIADRLARSTPLGLPGGPCHIIRNIQEEKMPERMKRELQEDIEKGKEIDKNGERALYDPEAVPSKNSLFKSIVLTAHAQFRMDLRGITVPEVQKAFDEFTRWYTKRKNDTRSLKPHEQKVFQDIAYGNTVRFDSNLGVTIVFAIEGAHVRLVSCWWTNEPNPPKPRPGECAFIPYLDQKRNTEHPAVLGSELTKDPALLKIRQMKLTKAVEPFIDALSSLEYTLVYWAKHGGNQEVIRAVDKSKMKGTAVLRRAHQLDILPRPMPKGRAIEGDNFFQSVQQASKAYMQAALALAAEGRKLLCPIADDAQDAADAIANWADDREWKWWESDLHR